LDGLAKDYKFFGETEGFKPFEKNDPAMPGVPKYLRDTELMSA
jgi:hypothetical protein